MLEHIVKNGETIHDIMNLYHIELEEIKSSNLHITDLYNLASGMKIKIPLLHSEVEQILANTEPFVQKYYPKVNDLYEADREAPIAVQTNEPIESTPVAPPVVERKETIPPVVPHQTLEPKGRPYPGILPPKGPYGIG